MDRYAYYYLPTSCKANAKGISSREGGEKEGKERREGGQEEGEDDACSIDVRVVVLPET